MSYAILHPQQILLLLAILLIYLAVQSLLLIGEAGFKKWHDSTQKRSRPDLFAQCCSDCMRQVLAHDAEGIDLKQAISFLSFCTPCCTQITYLSGECCVQFSGKN